MFNDILKLYHSFDTRSKRCLMIDIYSIFFIVLPKRFFLSKIKGFFWGLSLLYLLLVVKGEEEKLLTDSKYIHIQNKKTKYNMI